MAIAMTSFDRESVFQIIMNVERKFSSQYGEKAKSAFELELNDEFSPIIYDVIKKAEGNVHQKDQLDLIDKTRKHVEDVRQTAASNIQAMVQRGKNLEELEKDTEELESTAIHFEAQTEAVENAMWYVEIGLRSKIKYLTFSILGGRI